MLLFQLRLFFRILTKSREVYFLKILTLAIALASTTLILLFAINEFEYDRFHQGYDSVFRVIQRNNKEAYIGNRFSNKIPYNLFNDLKSIHSDSLVTARVKLLDQLNVSVGDQLFSNSKVYAADPSITKIFSFEIVHGSLNEFCSKNQTILLSSSVAIQYFGTTQSQGQKLRINTFGDTLNFTVAAVYKDYPKNSHEDFNSFIRFDSLTLQALKFNPTHAGLYGRLIGSQKAKIEDLINRPQASNEWTYKIQPISEIYFGPRVAGEDAKHGDEYSIIILLCITALILFLSLTSFINLTTLALPDRAKELAIKKLAGSSQMSLVLDFAKESFGMVGISLLIGIVVLILISNWVKSILSIDVISLFLQADLQLMVLLVVLSLVIAIAPLFMTLRFIRTTPNRLLSTETISFPRFKRTIMFLQLGISIFLIAASLVIKRQINYSLLKEPGRNYDQIVYVDYPTDLSNEGLASMRLAWKKMNANIVDIMATSQLPDRVSSKELNADFYFVSVDRGFKDFFELEIIRGNWFKANDDEFAVVVNAQGSIHLGNNRNNVVGEFNDLSEQFNQPEKPLKLNVSPHFKYNYLCIRILEVDIRRTVKYLENYFAQDGEKATVSFLNRRFADWLNYQDKLNALSEIVAIISALLSCIAIYGLSMSIVRDKLKQIAIHKLCGANTFTITRILMKEFARQMLLAILVFGPLSFMIIQELLRSFVYRTDFIWLDPILPLAYCVVVITLLCGFQTLSLNRADLSSALKG